MKHKRIMLKAVAVIAAFSVAFVSEGAAFSTVMAAGGSAPSATVFDGSMAVSQASYTVNSESSQMERGGVKMTLKIAYTVDI